MKKAKILNIFILSVNEFIYSTNRLLEEAKNRGHNVKVVNHTKCTVKLSNKKRGVFYNGRNILNDAKIIIPRIGTSVTQHGALIVNEFELNNIKSTASSSGIVLSQNKVESLQLLSKHRIPIPETIFSVNPEDISNQINMLGGTPIIIKLLDGTQGKGVILADSIPSAKSIIDTFYGMHKNILLQEFVKESKSEDIRVFVVGGKVVSAMKRIGSKNDFRSNIHQGGRGEKAILSSKEEEIALEAAKLLNLPIAGVDLIRSKRGPLVLEVNSTPGLQGVEAFTKVNVALEIIKHIENTCS